MYIENKYQIKEYIDKKNRYIGPFGNANQLRGGSNESGSLCESKH